MRFTPLFLAAVCAVTAAQPALAQNANQSTETKAMQSAPQIELTDKKMDQYVEAQQEVINISDRWSAKLKDASNAEKQEVAPQINNEMTEAVRDAGLSVEEFNRIAMVVRQNPALREEVIKQLQ